MEGESTKVVMIYSGKGGVGKTTTTVNIAKALNEQGKKVYILDGDINTPSIPVYFPVKNPNELLMIGSTGYEYSGMIYLEKALVRSFITKCINEIEKFKPDFVLVDTPPSITDVHINLIEKLEVSGVLVVTQPTELSRSDVKRTGIFFQNRNIPIIGIIENMVQGNVEEGDYVWKTLGRIPFAENFSGESAYNQNSDIYKNLASDLNSLESVILENKKRFLFDESITYNEIEEDFRQSGVWGLAKEKELKFINLSTWENVRNEIEELQANSKLLSIDRLIQESTFERVSRLVKAFENDEQAYFMIVNAPCTNIKVFPGEIGQCSLIMSPAYYNLPCVNYQTREGSVMMFPHEVRPVTGKEVNDFIADGYKLLPDGRYIPPKEVLEELDNTFGFRVGLRDGWEKEYDKIISPVKEKEIVTK